MSLLTQDWGWIQLKNRKYNRQKTNWLDFQNKLTYNCWTSEMHSNVALCLCFMNNSHLQFQLLKLQLWPIENSTAVVVRSLQMVSTVRLFPPHNSGLIVISEPFRLLLWCIDHSSQDSVWESLTNSLLIATTCHKTEHTSVSSGQLSVTMFTLLFYSVSALLQYCI